MLVRLCIRIQYYINIVLQFGNWEWTRRQERRDLIKKSDNIFSFLNEEKQDNKNSDRIKILKMIFEESPTVCSQLLFCTRNEIAYWGSFKSSQLICCACIRSTKNSLYSFSTHKSPQYTRSLITTFLSCPIQKKKIRELPNNWLIASKSDNITFQKETTKANTYKKVTVH